MAGRLRMQWGFLALFCAALWVGPGPAARADDPPHPRGAAWLDKAGWDFHGRSSLACEDCHEPGLWCASCHFGPGGSRVPPGSGWRHGRSGHWNLRASAAVCTRCHDLNRRLGHGPRSCHDCHGDGDEDEREHRDGHERDHGEREHRGGRHEREHDD